MTPAPPKKYYYEFSPVLILELRHIFQQTNAGELDVKAAFAAWQKGIDEEIPDTGFRAFVVDQFSIIMSSIARGEDDIVVLRDIGGEVFLRINGEEVEASG